MSGLLCTIALSMADVAVFAAANSEAPVLRRSDSFAPLPNSSNLSSLQLRAFVDSMKMMFNNMDDYGPNLFERIANFSGRIQAKSYI
ncbi:MAG: hypothetical protein C0440_00260 [Candidatus Pelagibacter sp.]|nr:hypothetical protein [Candidatus Pelagibacter sp.]